MCPRQEMHLAVGNDEPALFPFPPFDIDFFCKNPIKVLGFGWMYD